jgi:hypothetical protein
MQKILNNFFFVFFFEIFISVPAQKKQQGNVAFKSSVAGWFS